MDVHLDLCFDTCPENLISVPVIESQHVPWRHLHTEMIDPLGGRLAWSKAVIRTVRESLVHEI